MMNKKLLPALLAGWLLPAVARAADLDGSQLSVLWGVPFAGVLLSIALMPLLAPSFWHHHFGKVAAAWGLAFLVPFALTFGFPAAGAAVVHSALADLLLRCRDEEQAGAPGSTSPSLLERLQQQCGQRAPLFDPARERAALLALGAELLARP